MLHKKPKRQIHTPEGKGEIPTSNKKTHQLTKHKQKTWKQVKYENITENTKTEKHKMHFVSLSHLFQFAVDLCDLLVCDSCCCDLHYRATVSFGLDLLLPFSYILYTYIHTYKDTHTTVHVWPAFNQQPLHRFPFHLPDSRATPKFHILKGKLSDISEPSWSATMLCSSRERWPFLDWKTHMPLPLFLHELSPVCLWGHVLRPPEPIVWLLRRGLTGTDECGSWAAAVFTWQTHVCTKQWRW